MPIHNARTHLALAKQRARGEVREQALLDFIFPELQRIPEQVETRRWKWVKRRKWNIRKVRIDIFFGICLRICDSRINTSVKDDPGVNSPERNTKQWCRR